MKLILLLALCALLSTTQGRAVFSPESAATLGAQQIGPRDPIAILVYGLPELSRSEQVGSDGVIRLPLRLPISCIPGPHGIRGKRQFRCRRPYPSRATRTADQTARTCCAARAAIV